MAERDRDRKRTDLVFRLQEVVYEREGRPSAVIERIFLTSENQVCLHLKQTSLYSKNGPCIMKYDSLEHIFLADLNERFQIDCPF